MNIDTFSIINIVLSCITLILCGSSFTIAVYYPIKQDKKLMQLFAGMMLAYFFNCLGNLLGLIQIFIYPLGYPNKQYCNNSAFMQLFGLLLLTIYQILIDLCLYLNIYNWKSYQIFMKSYMMKTQIIAYSVVLLLCTILLCLNQYTLTQPVYDANCWLNLSSVTGKVTDIIAEDFLPLIALIFNVYVVVRTIEFYKQFSFSQIDKKRIQAYTLFPIVYGIMSISNLLFAILYLSGNYSQPLNNDTQIPPNMIDLVIYILLSSRGSFISLLFFYLIHQFYTNESKQGFILTPIDSQSEEGQASYIDLRKLTDNTAGSSQL